MTRRAGPWRATGTSSSRSTLAPAGIRAGRGRVPAGRGPRGSSPARHPHFGRWRRRRRHAPAVGLALGRIPGADRPRAARARPDGLAGSGRRPAASTAYCVSDSNVRDSTGGACRVFAICSRSRRGRGTRRSQRRARVAGARRRGRDPRGPLGRFRRRGGRRPRGVLRRHLPAWHPGRARADDPGSPRSTPPTGGRPASTCPPRRTTWGSITSPPASWSTRIRWRACRPPSSPPAGSRF